MVLVLVLAGCHGKPSRADCDDAARHLVQLQKKSEPLPHRAVDDIQDDTAAKTLAVDVCMADEAGWSKSQADCVVAATTKDAADECLK